MRSNVSSARQCIDMAAAAIYVADPHHPEAAPLPVHAQTLVRYHVAAMRQPATDQREYRERVGDVIQRARETRGWSQTELGQRIGVSRSTVAKYEAGTSSILLEQIPRLIETLGLSWRAITEPPPKRQTIQSELAPYLAEPTGGQRPTQPRRAARAAQRLSDQTTKPAGRSRTARQ